MTRANSIAALASRFPSLTVEDDAIAVKEMLDAIGHALVQGGRVERRDFGRNPKSGETVSVPDKYAPHFKAGKNLRKRVDQSMR